MELDDLRRQWQQSKTAPPPVSPSQLKSLLARRSTGIIEKMRRNTWLEMALTGLLIAAMLYQTDKPVLSVVRLFYGIMLPLLGLAMLYYYYRQLRLLGRMAHAEAHVRQHLGVLCAGLRQLLQFYYRLTLATVPGVLVLMWCYQLGLEVARNGGARWERLGTMAGVLLVGGALLQVGTVYGTRWYLHKLYGQHLDRLEASLRELSEEDAGPIRH